MPNYEKERFQIGETFNFSSTNLCLVTMWKTKWTEWNQVKQSQIRKMEKAIFVHKKETQKS